MQQSIVKFIVLSYRHCSTCSGITMPIIRSPSNCRCSLWFSYECGGGSVLSRPRLRTLSPPHSYGNQRLQRQFDRLLVMGIVMPETCWAVSVRQSNKFYNWLLHLVGCFIWVYWTFWFMPSWSLLISQSLICNVSEHVLDDEDLQHLINYYLFQRNRGLDIQLCC